MIRIRTGIRSIVYWTAAFLLLAALPLLILLITTSTKPAGQGWAWDFALALGFAVITLMLLMFVLTSRFRRLAAPFGIDLVYYFHRQIAIGLSLLALVHVALLLTLEPVLINWLLPTAPAHMLAGTLALVSLLLLVAVSVLRRRVRLRYEAWRRTHLMLAIIAVLAGSFHILGVHHYSDSPLIESLALVALPVWLILILRVRLFKPWWLSRHHWHVVSVTPERGGAVTIDLKPESHTGLRFVPGQFAWLTVNQSPYAMAEHPFSIASSANQNGSLGFTIKALGDFTTEIQKIKPGTTVYVDGAYGTFSMDTVDADALFFVAGGIGIVPIMSMLRTLADRNDRRPLTLVYAAKDLDNMTYYEELQSLTTRLDLRFMPVPTRAPENWQGASGYVDHALLKQCLPDRAHRVHYFLCGPPPMLRATESALHQCGVHYRQVHSELFNLV